ncbi:prepilin peptidase [Pseudomonas sp. P9(2020)]|uniref:prepilin peptidase n=1 Tax=Pseudomonas sp. P9(2020) TaxID=2763316 RepID=UPI001B33EA6A|nr:A24 family peptidase [Pseudomonas sp. P9(2020)]MBP5948068.1 prepilin peptidase [Pseudomonas sp. P9(2020)]
MSFVTTLPFWGDYSINSICLSVCLGLAGGHVVRHVTAHLPAWLERNWRVDAQEILGVVPQELASTEPHPPTVLSTVEQRVIAFKRAYRATGEVDQCRFPIWELVGAVLVVLSGWQSGFNLWGLAVALGLMIGLAAAIVDARTMLLPDVLVLPTIWLGLTATALCHPALLQENVLACAAGYLCLFLLPMGRGDAKLFAAIGAWAGYEGLIMAITAGGLLGVVVGLYLRLKRGESKPYPFGPFLYLGLVLSLLYPEAFQTMQVLVRGHWVG